MAKVNNGNGILYNKYLLYFILIVSLTDLLYYAIAKKYLFIIIFFIIGYLTHFFSKNMTVIMCISLAFTNILSMGSKGGGIVNEGFKEEKGKGKRTKSPTTKPPTKPPTKSPNKEKMSQKKVSFTDEPEKEGMKSLDEKTKELMETQKQLMDNMKNLEPMLSKAEGFLEKFKNSSSE